MSTITIEDKIIWVSEHKGTLRRVILALLLVTMLGPWMFDVIHVPAEYACSLPNVRLHGDFCGMPLSGVRFFEWFLGGFFYMLPELINGTFAGRFRELLTGLSMLPLVPFLTTLLLIWTKETPRLRTINLVAWILALLSTLILFLFQITPQSIRLWGLWLYIITAILALMIEINVMKKDQSRLTDFPT